VGEIEETFDDVVATGRYTPVVVCGRNERLRKALDSRGVGYVMGWTDQMPALMAASDALVQNAGGLTCMEAFAAGLPVVSYRPIAGHGKENALEMERAKVAVYAREPHELGPALDHVTGPGRDELLSNADAMFDGDAADDVLRIAGATPPPAPDTVTIPPDRPRRRLVATVAAAVAVAWVVFTMGIGVATANGIGVVRPRPGGETAYLAMRVGPAAIQNPELAAALNRSHITAIVDGSTAVEEPEALKRFAATGVDVANGGWGRHVRMPWQRAHDDLKKSASAIRDATGLPVRDFVPGRRVNGFDLTWARVAHERVIVPQAKSDEIPRKLGPGAIYLVDARDADGAEAMQMIRELEERLAGERLRAANLSELR
jgi:hypothetical protein